MQALAQIPVNLKRSGGATEWMRTCSSVPSRSPRKRSSRREDGREKNPAEGGNVLRLDSLRLRNLVSRLPSRPSVVVLSVRRARHGRQSLACWLEACRYAYRLPRVCHFLT